VIADGKQSGSSSSLKADRGLAFRKFSLASGLRAAMVFGYGWEKACSIG
jgi:hypothetical protein